MVLVMLEDLTKAQEHKVRYFKFVGLNYPGIDSFFISWFIAIFYSLFGQSELMAKALSLFGMNSIFLGYIVFKKYGVQIFQKNCMDFSFISYFDFIFMHNTPRSLYRLQLH